MWRHSPQTQLILDLLPQVGEVRGVHVTFTAMLMREDDPRWVPELGGGALLDVGCYCVSAARLLLGEPDRVHGEARIGRGGVDTQFAGTLRFGAVLATFECGLRSAFSNTLEVIGTDGILRVPSPFVDPPGLVVVNGEEHRVDAGNHYRAELDDVLRRDPRRAQRRFSAATRCAGQATVLDALLTLCRLALLAGVQQVLRVEGLLDPRVQVVAGRAELVLRAGRASASRSPCSPVTVPPRRSASSNSSWHAASARCSSSGSSGEKRNVEWMLPSPACPNESAGTPWRSPISSVSRATSRSRSSGTAMSSLKAPPRCARIANAAPPRQRHSSATSDGSSRRVHGDGVLGERLAAARPRRGAPRRATPSASVITMNAAPSGQAERIRVARVGQRDGVEVLDRRGHDARREHTLDRARCRPPRRGRARSPAARARARARAAATPR